MTRHTKLIDNKEYIKWYNLAKKIVNDKELIPDRTDEQIMKLVSDNNWLIFSGNILENKEEARTKAEPNVFFELLTEESVLTGFGTLGLTFDKIEIVRNFASILHDANKETKDAMNKKLKSELKYDWDLSVNRKLKEHNRAETPDYHQVKKWNIKEFGEKIVDEAVEIAKKIEEEGKINKERILNQRALEGNKSKYYCELPTIELIINRNFNLAKEYEGRIAEIFSVLKLVLSVKGTSETKKIDKERKEDEKYLEILNDKIEMAKNGEEVDEEEFNNWIKRRDELKRKLKREN